MKKIKDLFNVLKYRKEINTIENRYSTLIEKYTTLLEKDRSMLDDNINLKNRLLETEKIIKEYKKQYGKLEIKEVD